MFSISVFCFDCRARRKECWSKRLVTSSPANQDTAAFCPGLTAGREGAIFIPSVTFEFGPKKSAANEKKHRIGFVAAQELWEDVNRLELAGDSRIEFRNLLVARRGGKLWAAVFTIRGENIRIISVRRARDDEEEAYYEQTKEEDDGEGV